ncbi:MAG: NifU N-terminal domain-containing protein [Acidimicrobiales bacterium]|nr:NifU N-terminal domain-containing protein [Acidimicrobiales bacterium]MCB1015916.1 NifU N-terminal domain-containing protein [Acidimicrobiales bacterium]MCB9372732.1 NifU N-terminal domain-containing protein [Microthrixaceae bacterium]
MAHAEPSPTPNPDALKFTLDRTLPAMINLERGADTDDPFAAAVLAADGVAAVFATNDFVTVRRQADAEWPPIVAAVQAAAAEHL